MEHSAAKMCNLYSLTRPQDEIRRLFEIETDRTGNLPSMPGIFPDYAAPIVHVLDGKRALSMYRWGMPMSESVLEEAASARADKLRNKGKTVDFEELLKMEPSTGVTNVRQAGSPHWRRWLKPESRCLVPFTSFSEFNKVAGGDIWFSASDARPLACFAGIRVEGWTSVRKIRSGPETLDLYAFLTTKASDPVKKIHPKAMPVILRTDDERDRWLRADWSEAKKLQRPLPDGELTIVAKGRKRDGE